MKQSHRQVQPDDGDGVAPWAHRLATRRLQVARGTESQETETHAWVTAAVDQLWAMFDEAVTETQHALRAVGLPDAIEVERTECDYCVSMPGPDGQPRQICLFSSLRDDNGQVSGGAHISTSQTRATMYLVPAADHGHVWKVRSTGAEFTPRAVSDLFLSVFSDDPAANRRLSPLFTPAT